MHHTQPMFVKSFELFRLIETEKVGYNNLLSSLVLFLLSRYIHFDKQNVIVVITHDVNTQRFELFRRAIVDRNEDAWEIIITNYRPLVTNWIRRHPHFPDLNEDVQYILNGAFGKFWRGMTPDKFAESENLRAILGYLNTCIHSVIVDSARKQEKADLFSELPDASGTESHPDLATEDNTADQMRSREFWDWLDERLKDEKERRVIYGRFVLGLKPGEIYAQYQELFRDVNEVYRIKENFIARLRRDKGLGSFFSDMS
jgi:DNA-directed RNA polymerase specialized sigma24 family protein